MFDSKWKSDDIKKFNKKFISNELIFNTTNGC